MSCAQRAGLFPLVVLFTRQHGRLCPLQFVGHSHVMHALVRSIRATHRHLGWFPPKKKQNTTKRPEPASSSRWFRSSPGPEDAEECGEKHNLEPVSPHKSLEIYRTSASKCLERSTKPPAIRRPCEPWGSGAWGLEWSLWTNLYAGIDVDLGLKASPFIAYFSTGVSPVFGVKPN